MQQEITITRQVLFTEDNTLGTIHLSPATVVGVPGFIMEKSKIYIRQITPWRPIEKKRHLFSPPFWLENLNSRQIS